VAVLGQARPGHVMAKVLGYLPLVAQKRLVS
jgi:hypothetical protein